MTMLENMRTKLAKLAGVLTDVAAHDQTLRGRHRDGLARKAALLAGRGTKGDAQRGARVLVAGLRDVWRYEHGFLVIAALSGEYETDEKGRLRISGPVVPLPLMMGSLTFSALCGIAPAAVEAGLLDLIEYLNVPWGDVPLSDRPKLVAELDQELRDIENEHESLCDEAGRLDPPMTIQHLDPSGPGARPRRRRPRRPRTRPPRSRPRPPGPRGATASDGGTRPRRPGGRSTMTRHEFLTQLTALAGRVPEGDFHVVLGDLRRYLPATPEGPPLDYRGAPATDAPPVPWSPGDLRIFAASLGWPPYGSTAASVPAAKRHGRRCSTPPTTTIAAPCTPRSPRSPARPPTHDEAGRARRPGTPRSPAVAGGRARPAWPRRLGPLVRHRVAGDVGTGARRAHTLGDLSRPDGVGPPASPGDRSGRSAAAADGADGAGAELHRRGGADHLRRSGDRGAQAGRSPGCRGKWPSTSSRTAWCSRGASRRTGGRRGCRVRSRTGSARACSSTSPPTIPSTSPMKSRTASTTSRSIPPPRTT